MCMIANLFSSELSVLLIITHGGMRILKSLNVVQTCDDDAVGSKMFSPS